MFKPYLQLRVSIAKHFFTWKKKIYLSYVTCQGPYSFLQDKHSKPSLYSVHWTCTLIKARRVWSQAVKTQTFKSKDLNFLKTKLNILHIRTLVTLDTTDRIHSWHRTWYYNGIQIFQQIIKFIEHNNFHKKIGLKDR